MKGMKTDPASVAERHSKRKGWFLAEASRQASNRAMMAKAEAFYDGNQWSHDDAETVPGAVKVVAAKSLMLKRLVFLADSDPLVFAG